MPELNLDEYLALNDVEFTTEEISKASDVISHFGIPGMIHGRRRFQYEDGSLTPAGRERYGVGPARDSTTSESTEQAAKEEHERYRQEALRSGDPKRIKEVMKESSYQEIKDALDRVDIYEKVNAKIPPEPSTMDKINKIVSNANTINNWVTTGTNIWNNFARIHNAVSQDGSDLPIIGQDNSKNRTADQKAAALIDKQERALVKNAIKSGDPQKIQSVLSKMNATELNDANTMLKNKEALNMTIKDQSPETKKAREELNKIIMSGDNTALLNTLSSYTSDQLTQAQNRSNAMNNLQKSVMVRRARSMQSNGKTYEEIAEALNIPKGSVGNLLFGG